MKSIIVSILLSNFMLSTNFNNNENSIYTPIYNEDVYSVITTKIDFDNTKSFDEVFTLRKVELPKINIPVPSTQGYHEQELWVVE